MNDLLADWLGVDEWIDRMLGKPIERLDAQGKRRPEDYGYVGQFFQHFTEGITHLLFAQDVRVGPPGEWSRVGRIPASGVTAVFAYAFTQYFPHEHTDQPPYVWDASRRPGKAMYEPGPRRTGRPARGIMNIVHEHYIGYMAERLSTLENEWRSIGRDDLDKRRMWLVEMGKVLHAIEDWFFHSNVVELIHLHQNRPDEVPEREREAFVKRVIVKELGREPELSAATANRSRLQRYFYRRLRFPVYGHGTRENTGGVPSTETSILNWDHAYPAFPSTLDTAHTLLGALEGLEAKVGGGTRLRNLDPAHLDLTKALNHGFWLICLLKKFHAAGPNGAAFTTRRPARGRSGSTRAACLC